MKRLLLFFLITLFPKVLFAQLVTVQDSSTKTVLSGVSVYNKSHSTFTQTDLNGTFDSGLFDDKDLIIFRLMGYELLSISKQNIQSDTLYLTPKVEGLSEIVVSASKFRQDIRRLPVRVRRIDADDISMMQPQTTADLLSRTGSVYVQKSQLGGGSPMIRGFATNRVLITVDGIRMNNAIFRGGNLQNVISIDPYVIESSELIFGPGTVISGSDAIGGVMNFNTRRLPFAKPDSLIDKTDLAFRSSTATKERTYHVGHMQSSGNWTGYVSFSRMNLGDLTMGRYGPESYLREQYVRSSPGEDVVVFSDNPERQRGTAFSSTYFTAKAEHLISNNWEQRMGLFYSTTSDYGRYDRLLRPKGDGFRSAEWFYGPQRWLMTYWNPRYASDHSAHQFSIAYQSFEESRNDRDFNSEIRNTAIEKVGVLNLSYDSQYEISEQLIARGGGSLDLNKVNSEAYSLNLISDERGILNSRYPDGATWNAAGVYFSTEYKPSKPLVLNLGIRWNQVSSKTDYRTNPFTEVFGIQKLKNSAFTYGLGGVYRFDRFTSMRFNLSTAFRAPNIDDLAKVFDSEPGSVVIPNPDLKPEYAQTIELGIRKRFDRSFMIDAAVYYSTLDDALIRRNTTLNGQSQLLFRDELSQLQSIQNAASAEVAGIEWSIFGYLSRKLSYRFLGTYTRGEEIDDTGASNPLRHAPPFFSNSQLRYVNGSFQLILESEYNAEVSAEDLPISESSKAYMYALDSNGNPYSPSWHAVHLRLRQQWKRWQCSVAIENIFDRRYRPFASGISAPGRQLVVAFQTIR